MVSIDTKGEFSMSVVPYTVEQIISFCRDKNYKIVIVSRKDRKNQLFRESVGMTYEEEQKEIRSLRKEFLIKGPFPDKDNPNNYLYEFHKEVRGKWCYIKLTIVDQQVVVKVISFHESEGTEYD